jgi:hypothetical protein
MIEINEFPPAVGSLMKFDFCEKSMQEEKSIQSFAAHK